MPTPLLIKPQPLHKLLLTSLLILFLLKAERTQAQCDACEAPVQLINNGDFSQGNVGFTTSLSLGSGFFCPLCPEGTYAVGSFAFFYHSDFIGQDHTNPPNGQFFIANAAASEGQSIWCQTVNVEPSVEYTFSFWVRDVTNNSDSHPLAILQAYFNGIPEGSSITAYEGWQQNSFTWNSGTSASVEICLLNFQSNSGGNDFGLDDISLTGCHPVDVQYPANAGSDIEVCSNEPFQIGTTSNNGYNYSWTSIPPIATLTNSGIQTLQITNTSGVDMSYQLELVSDSASLGCITSDMVEVVVHSAVDVHLPETPALCPGESYDVTLENIWDSVLWSDGSSSLNFSTSENGIVSVVVSQNGCESSDAVEISVIELPELNIGPDVELCETSLPYLLESDIDVEWSDGSFGSTYAVTAGGNYSASYEIFNCATSTSVNVEVYEMPVADLNDEYTFCEGNSVEVVNSQSGTWSNGTTGSSTLADEEGILSLIVVNGPCTAQDGTQIIMRSIPEIDLGWDIEICDGESVVLDAYAAMAESYDWSNDSITPQVEVRESGYYEVTVSNECGSASDAIYVSTNLCGWGLYIPNAFTPNLDDKNEGWSVQGYNITNLKVFVYNRFGDLIWYTDQLNDPWIPNSKTIGDDAYTYRVEAINYNGENIIRHGYVQLLK